MNTQKVKLYSIHQRKHKVQLSDFAKLTSPQPNFSEWLDALPTILSAKDFNLVVYAILNAYYKHKPVIVMLGGHVIKCGVTPLLIDLMQRGIITGVVMNGSASIHDTEVALIGQTSEDVAKGLDDGTFGMVQETGELMHAGIQHAYEHQLGMGEGLGYWITKKKLPFMKYSLLSNANKLKIPVTVHTAIGTDTIYQHPDVNGAAMGETSLRDFHQLAVMLRHLNNGGVVLNIGSAVILPEVFLKALTIARNSGASVKNFTTANFDMVQHYRPTENVVSRPVRTGGHGVSITGHHEIMIPLLYASLISKLSTGTNVKKTPKKPRK